MCARMCLQLCVSVLAGLIECVCELLCARVYGLRHVEVVERLGERRVEACDSLGVGELRQPAQVCVCVRLCVCVCACVCVCVCLCVCARARAVEFGCMRECV